MSGWEQCFSFCAKKSITLSRYVEKYVFARIQHIIFCLKSKTDERKIEWRKRVEEREAEKSLREKIKSKGKRNKKKGEI